jgi:hypothetical protein
VPRTGSGKGDWGSGPSCVALGRAGPMRSSYRAKQNGHWVASEEKWNGLCTREMKRKHWPGVGKEKKRRRRKGKMGRLRNRAQ